MRFIRDPFSLDEIREFFAPGRMIKAQFQVTIGSSAVTEPGDRFLVLSLPKPSGDPRNQLVIFKILLEKKGVFDFEISRYWNYPILLDVVSETKV